MVFIKVQKTPQYFSNYQPKRRRRREGKTDYKARRALVTQDLCKYGAPKYRLVVRRTNRRIIAQIIYATLEGDKIVCSADSFELKAYGLKAGLKNYAAAYCVGLLCSRRLLTDFGVADQFVGVEEATGEEFHIEEEETEKRPFKAVLDIGLVRSTKGNRVFGCMKGAVDGGLHVPHSESCFPGEDDAEVHLERILGQHVADYQEHVKEEGGEEKMKEMFSEYVKGGVTGDNVAEMYKSVHAAIRANPSRKVVDKAARKAALKSAFPNKRPTKLNAVQRRERVNAKISAMAADC